MASLFGHIAASSALGYAGFNAIFNKKTAIIAAFCAFAPDFDVLAFHFGIPYNSPWGHRGWTHSISFAFILGGVATLLCQCLSARRPNRPLALFAFFTLSTLSHPLLDMLTNGGRGCALFWPFDNSRIFFPWRPIQVSPLGADAFFSEWGLSVLWSELWYIGIPSLLISFIYRSLQIWKP